jgi:hypothetical protein
MYGLPIVIKDGKDCGGLFPIHSSTHHYFFGHDGDDCILESMVFSMKKKEEGDGKDIACATKSDYCTPSMVTLIMSSIINRTPHSLIFSLHKNMY